MFKFFRNIRRGLLKENKMGKYLGYAVGEVVLVVIGILIALQLNNWNESRKSKLKARVYREQFLSDIKENDSLLLQTLGQLQGSKNAVIAVMEFREKGFNSDPYPADKYFTAEPVSSRLKGFTLDAVVDQYVPVSDTLTLVRNLNRAGFVTTFSIKMPTWDEIISNSQADLINQDLKNELLTLQRFSERAQLLEVEIYLPQIRAYNIYREGFYNITRSASFVVDSTNQFPIDINAIQSDTELLSHLRKLYRANHEKQFVLTSLLGNQLVRLEQVVLN